MGGAPRWLIVGAGLLLTAGPLRAQDWVELRGRVVEAGSAVPVAGARVVAESGAAAVTGPDGEWTLRVPRGTARLHVERVGFLTRTITLDPVAAADAGSTAPASNAGARPDEAGAMAAAATGSLPPIRIELVPTALALDEVIVTASRRTQRLAEAPVTTELIRREDLERSGSPDLSAVLIEQAGIQLQTGVSAGVGVMLQGLGSERVLVLVDGQPLLGRINGQIDVSRIPVSAVDRIEVVKGPQSTLYGSEAMGGVVNVITRSAAAERWRLNADFTAGSQGRLEGSGALSGTAGALRYVLNGGHREADVSPGQASTQGALSRRWDGLAKVEWTARQGVTAHASALALDERQRWRSGQLYSFSDNTQLGVELGARVERGAHRIAPTLYWTRFDHLSRQATGPEPVDGSGDRESQRLLEAELLYSAPIAGHVLDAGVEVKREEIVSARVADETRTLHTVEPFAQYTWGSQQHSIVPGVRVSWSEQWGTHVSPRLAAMVRPAPALTLRASVGRGFRAPSFKELYMEFLNTGPGFGYAVRGNPDVRPETSTSISAGAEWDAGRAYVRAQVFHNRFDDFIETRLAGDSADVTVYTYGNIAEGTTAGVELEGAVVLGLARLNAGYGYLRTRDSATGASLLGRPAHSARVAVDAYLPWNLRSAVTAVYTGRAPVQRLEDGGEVVRGAFTRVDVRFSRELPGGLQLAVGAHNAFDTQPELWPGYAGRQVYVNLGWTAGESR